MDKSGDSFLEDIVTRRWLYGLGFLFWVRPCQVHEDWLVDLDAVNRRTGSQFTRRGVAWPALAACKCKRDLILSGQVGSGRCGGMIRFRLRWARRALLGLSACPGACPGACLQHTQAPLRQQRSLWMPGRSWRCPRPECLNSGLAQAAGDWARFRPMGPL